MAELNTMKMNSTKNFVAGACLLIAASCSTGPEASQEVVTKEVDVWLHGETQPDGSKVYYTGLPRISKDFNGTVTTRFTNGAVSAEIDFEAGKPEGEWKEWYENGALRYEGTYVNGLRDGDWFEYSEEGKLISRSVWSHGVEA